MVHDLNGRVMKSRGKFITQFGVRGCLSALSIAVLISGSSIVALRYLSRTTPTQLVVNLATHDATILALHQQAASALASLQDASRNHH